MATKTTVLPDGITLETLKEQARFLQKAVAAGSERARARIEPYFRDLVAAGETSDPPKLRLQQAQLVLAREYGFGSWRRLKTFIEARDAFGQAARNVASIRDRMPKPSKALVQEMNAARREMAQLRRRFEKVAPEPPARDPDELYCSFCSKSQHEVDKLIAGPDTYICDECIALCNTILADAESPG